VSVVYKKVVWFLFSWFAGFPIDVATFSWQLAPVVVLVHLLAFEPVSRGKLQTNLLKTDI